MCWQCDHPEATRADYHDVLRRKILAHGWAVQYVESERTPFGYTIGLHPAGLPELLVAGLPPETTLKILNTLAGYMVREVEPAPGDTMQLADEWHGEFVAVAEPHAHMGLGLELYGPALRGLQFVWRDRDGHTPWCPDFNKGGLRQPVLGNRGPSAHSP